MRERGRLLGALCGLLAVSSASCERAAHSWYIADYDRDIRRFTREIETARDDRARAAGYARRGLAYSDRARYSKFATFEVRQTYFSGRA